MTKQAKLVQTQSDVTASVNAVDGLTSVFNGLCVLYGIYVDTTLSAHTLLIYDGTTLVLTIPASTTAGTNIELPGIRLNSSLHVKGDDSATAGVITLSYRAVNPGASGDLVADPTLTLLAKLAADKTLVSSVGPTFSIVRAGATATRFNSSGVMETGIAANTARFDHTPITGSRSLGLLVEEVRIQIAVDTGDVSDNAVWVPTNMTKGSDSVTDPTGTANTNVRLTAAAGNATLLQTVTSASDNYIYGVYMKRITGTGNIDLTLDDGVTWATKILTTDWTRFDVTDASETNPVFGVRIVTSGDAIDFWGSDVNKDETFLTSHIPNNADSGTVTRNADVVSTTDVSWYSAGTAMTVYIDTDAPFAGSSNAYSFGISDNSSSDRVVALRFSGTAARTLTAATAGNAGNVQGAGNWVDGQSSKMAIGFDTNDLTVYFDGSQLATQDTTADLPVGITHLYVGANETGISQWNGHIAEIRYYNVRKDNQFLEDLSSGLIPA